MVTFHMLYTHHVLSFSLSDSLSVLELNYVVTSASVNDDDDDDITGHTVSQRCKLN